MLPFIPLEWVKKSTKPHNCSSTRVLLYISVHHISSQFISLPLTWFYLCVGLPTAPAPSQSIPTFDWPATYSISYLNWTPAFFCAVGCLLCNLALCTTDEGFPIIDYCWCEWRKSICLWTMSYWKRENSGANASDTETRFQWHWERRAATYPGYLRIVTSLTLVQINSILLFCVFRMSNPINLLTAEFFST